MCEMSIDDMFLALGLLLAHVCCLMIVVILTVTSIVWLF